MNVRELPNSLHTTHLKLTQQSKGERKVAKSFGGSRRGSDRGLDREAQRGILTTLSLPDAKERIPGAEPLGCSPPKT